MNELDINQALEELLRREDVEELIRDLIDVTNELTEVDELFV
jgi:hypothetical protein